MAGMDCYLVYCRITAIDAYTTDDHGKSTYAPSFEGTLTCGYDLITAFEVFEHLPYPSSSLQRLFEVEPRFIVGSTEIYSGQTRVGGTSLRTPVSMFSFTRLRLLSY